MMGQLDTSLRRLRTDHVDVWLAHTWDDDTPRRGDRRAPSCGRSSPAGRATSASRTTSGGRRPAPCRSSRPPGCRSSRTRSSTASCRATPERELVDAVGRPRVRAAALVAARPGRARRASTARRCRPTRGWPREEFAAVRRPARRRPHARRRRGGAHRGRAGSGVDPGGRRPGLGARPAGRRRRRSSGARTPTQLRGARWPAEDVELPEQIVHALDEVSVEHA